MRARLISMVAVFLFTAALAVADPIFTLIPADIYGDRGQTIGWGVTLTNNDPDGRTLALTGLSFEFHDPWYVDNSDLSPFELGQPLDLFQALLFSEIASSETLEVTFDLDAGTGFYGIIFDPAVDPHQAGFPTDRGTFVLSGQYSDGTQVSMRADYSATIEQQTIVPEPATIVLMLGGLGLAAGRRRFRRF